MNNINELELKAEKIIADLLELDNSLKPLESELRKLVAEFIKNKPEPLLSQKFETELKSVLVEKIKELKNKNMKEENVFKQEVFFKKLAFSFGSIILALIIILPTVNFLKNKNLANNEVPMSGDGAIKITRLDDKAFGEITFQNNVANEGAEENFVKPMMATGLGSGADLRGEIASSEISETYLVDASATVSNDQAVSVTPIATKVVSGMGSASPAGMGGFDGDIGIMPIFEYPSFSYVYEGDDLTEFVAGLDKVDVYKRAKSEYSNPSLLNFITNLGSDLINLKKFNNSNTKVSYFSINEEKEFGYVLSFDANSGGISLYQNWQYWPQPANDCRDEACFARYRFNYDDLISNEEAIIIAENFLTNFSVDRAAYGEAKVNYNFHEIYQTSENKTELYVPEETTIIFPILIEGKEVKDEGGQAYGLYVNVNSRHKKVSGLNNLLPNRYEVSAYEVFNDAGEIKKLAEQGGLNFYKDPYATKEIQVYLGTPTLILSRQFQYGESYEYNSELFVPALSFPVLRLSEETQFFYQKNIVIPLVKDLIRQNNQGGGIGIMPYPVEDVAR